MKRVAYLWLCLCLMVQAVPVFSITLNTPPDSNPSVRVLEADELDGIVGGSNSHPPSNNTNIKVSDIPYYCQIVDQPTVRSYTVEGVAAMKRSESYCCIACCCMLADWNSFLSSKIDTEREIELWMVDRDEEACDRYYSWPLGINVYDNNGFMYYDWALTNNENMSKSIAGIKALYKDNAGIDSMDVYTRKSPQEAFDSLWNHVKDNQKPGLMVIKSGHETLHYIICSGIYEKSGKRNLYINDPLPRPEGGGDYIRVSESLLLSDLEIINTWTDDFKWVGDRQNGDAIYSVIND